MDIMQEALDSVEEQYLKKKLSCKLGAVRKALKTLHTRSYSHAHIRVMEMLTLLYSYKSKKS